jgi:hypothetical protein
MVLLTKNSITKLFDLRKSLVDLKKTHGDLYHFSAWSGCVDWIANDEGNKYEGNDLADELDTWDFGLNDYLLLKKDFEFTSMRSECDQLIIVDDSFHWECYAKHTSVTHSTAHFLFSDFEKYL